MPMVKISDAELPLMEYIWEHAPVAAAQLSAFAQEQFGWKKNTVYAVIKRLCERGAVSRRDPGIIIEPLVTREQVQRAETDELIDKVYKGSLKMFFVSFLEREDISDSELDELHRAIEKRKKADR